MPAIRRDTIAPDSGHVLAGIQHLVRRMKSTASPSMPQTLGARALQPRQTECLIADNCIFPIPEYYKGLSSGPPPGEVVGIVLGSVAGFLLLIWLFSALRNGGSFGGGSVVEEEVIVRRDRSPRSRRSRRSEMTSRSPRPERVIRQERIIRETSRAPPPMRPVVERRVDGDDIVEVIEEDSSVAPRRTSKSKRNSGRSVGPESFSETHSHRSFY